MKRVIFDTNVWVHILAKASVVDRNRLSTFMKDFGLQLFLTVQNIEEIAGNTLDITRRHEANVCRKMAIENFASVEVLECDELCFALAQSRPEWVDTQNEALLEKFEWKTWHDDVQRQSYPADKTEYRRFQSMHQELRSNRTVATAPFGEWSSDTVLAELERELRPSSKSAMSVNESTILNWANITQLQWEGEFRRYLIKTFVELHCRSSVSMSEPYFGQLYFPRLRCSPADFAKWALKDLADEKTLPTWRVSFALAAGQMSKSFNKGNVGDQNFAAYLPHISLFVTCDEDLATGLSSGPLLQWVPQNFRLIGQSLQELESCLHSTFAT